MTLIIFPTIMTTFSIWVTDNFLKKRDNMDDEEYLE